MVTRSAPLVASELRFGVSERTGPAGEVITRLDEQSVAEAVRLISNHKPRVESAAVCLLFSFANPAHEQLSVTGSET